MQGALIDGLALGVPDGSTQQCQATRPLHTHLEALLHPGCQLTPLDSLQSLFSDDFLQDLPVQRQIGNDALQARVLVLEYLETAKLGDAEISVLPLPDVVRGLRDSDTCGKNTITPIRRLLRATGMKVQTSDPVTLWGTHKRLARTDAEPPGLHRSFCAPRCH